MDRRKNGLWVHWIGDFVSMTVLLITFSVGYGRMQAQNDERDRGIAEIKQTQASERIQREAERKELKTDIQLQLSNINGSLTTLDTKLTALMLDRNHR